MLGSDMLDVAIGVIFVYVLISIVCTAVREGLEAWLKTRAAHLELGIRELLGDARGGDLATKLYGHPLIRGLFAETYNKGTDTKPKTFAKGGNLPSYIPARNFALALMDLAARGTATTALSKGQTTPLISLESIRSNLGENIPDAEVQRVLLTALDTAQGDLNRAQANLEAWYDSGMDRVSGWYKRATQQILFGIALFITVVLNVNTLTIADYLYRNQSARAALVARAQTAASNPQFASQGYQEAKADLEKLNLPIGWAQGWGAPRTGLRASDPWYVLAWNWVLGPVFGWLLTALAASLGAPFWFDVLNKVMVIRSTVKPHEKSPEESSEDRQTGGKRAAN